MITLKSEREIEQMRESGRLTAQVMDELAGMIRAGVTTAELDHRAGDLIKKKAYVKLFLGLF